MVPAQSGGRHGWQPTLDAVRAEEYVVGLVRYHGGFRHVIMLGTTQNDNAVESIQREPGLSERALPKSCVNFPTINGP
jgi:hypothetical protein